VSQASRRIFSVTVHFFDRVDEHQDQHEKQFKCNERMTNDMNFMARAPECDWMLN
jgi:hypothetical protein